MNNNNNSTINIEDNSTDTQSTVAVLDNDSDNNIPNNNITNSEFPGFERAPKYNESSLTPSNKDSISVIVGIIVFLVALLLFGVIGFAITLDSKKDTVENDATVDESGFFALVENVLDYLFEEDNKLEQFIIYQGNGIYDTGSSANSEIFIYSYLPQGYEIVDSYTDDYNNYVTALNGVYNDEYVVDIHCKTNVFQLMYFSFIQSAEDAYASLKNSIDDVEYTELGTIPAPYGDAYLLEYITNEGGVDYYNILACMQVDEENVLIINIDISGTDDRLKTECLQVLSSLIDWQYISVNN